MGLVGNNNEEKIWNFLKSKIPNNYGVAGLMGNLYAESALNPQNLQNTFETKLGYTDADYTAAVDNGCYSNFVKDSAGYGLAQWTYWTRKQNMLAYHKAAGKSIGDLETQLNFLIKELTENFGPVFSALKNAASVRAASDYVLIHFEAPKDQSTAVQAKRAGYGQAYYDKYAKASSSGETKTGGNTTMGVRAQDIIDVMEGWVGMSRAAGTHHPIIDLYNKHTPLARGYKVTYSDAYCDTTVSAAFIKLGAVDLIGGTECGVEEHIKLFKQKGIWNEDGTITPEPGYIICFNWDDNTQPNDGYADHIGVVKSVNKAAGTFVTVEGNMSGGIVGHRTLKIGHGNIRGYACPKYANASSGTAPEKQPAPTTGSETAAFKVGDKVQFNGSKHYASADAASGVTCKPGVAKVTQVYKYGKSKHPYHLVAENGGGSSVYGWVDAADVAAIAAAVKTHTVKAGDTLWGLAAKYLGSGARYPEIKKLNGLTSDLIKDGQVLKIPN